MFLDMHREFPERSSRRLSTSLDGSALAGYPDWRSSADLRVTARSVWVGLASPSDLNVYQPYFSQASGNIVESSGSASAR